MLLRELQGVPLRMLSTAFETGIGRRWLEHLAGFKQGPRQRHRAFRLDAIGSVVLHRSEQVWAAAG